MSRLPPSLRHSDRLATLVTQGFVPSTPVRPPLPPPQSGSPSAPPDASEVFESGSQFSIQIPRRARGGKGRGGRSAKGKGSSSRFPRA
eukprot:1225354-Pyramimonas_sp.AAC.1